MGTSFSVSEVFRVEFAASLKEVNVRRSYNLVEETVRLSIYEDTGASHGEKLLIQLALSPADTEESDVPAFSVVVQSELFWFESLLVLGHSEAIKSPLQSIAKRIELGLAYLKAEVGSDADAYEALKAEGVTVKTRLSPDAAKQSPETTTAS